MPAEEDKVTLPPVHNEVDPLVVIVGAEGFGFTVTTVGKEVPPQVPVVVTV